MGNKKLIWIIILAFLVVKLSQLMFFHQVLWDEAVYIGMGKYLASGGAVGIWEPFRPIVFPAILGTFWLLKLPIIFFGELFQIVVCTILIFLTYLIGEKLFSRNVGIISSLLLGSFPIFFEYSSKLFVGTISTMFVMLSFYLYTFKKHTFAGFFSGFSFLTRFPQGLFLVVLGIDKWIDFLIKKRLIQIYNGLKILLGFLIASIPYFIFNWFTYGAIFFPLKMASRHANNPFEAAQGSIIYQHGFYIIELFKQNWLVPFFIIGLYFAFKKKNRLLLLTLGIYLLYFSIIINKQLRFAISFLPIICILIAYGIVKTYKIMKSKLTKGIFILLIIFLLIPSLQLDLKYVEWRTAPKMPIVEEYHKYFTDKEVNGVILTSDPVPVAYADKKFEYFYDTVEQGLNTMHNLLPNVEFIVFRQTSYPCDNLKCEQDRIELFRLIKENKLIFNKTFYDGPVEIYSTTK